MALRTRRWPRRLAITALLLAVTVLAVTQLPPFGATPQGARLARVQRSTHYRDGHFVNLEPTNKLVPGTFWEMTQHSLFGDEQREPDKPIAIIARSA